MDVTIPAAAPERLVDRAIRHPARGFVRYPGDGGVPRLPEVVAWYGVGGED